jgi:F-type H+-transporting ATPase subunit epsilon
VADRTKFPVEVLTPEGEVFKDEVEMVSTRTSVGSIGVLANHAPLMAILEPTELRLYKSESDVVKFAQAEGYLQVVDNSALVLVQEAHEPDDLDRSDIESRLDEARKAMEDAEEGSEERARYERNIRRFEAFLEVAGGGSSSLHASGLCRRARPRYRPGGRRAP